MTGFAHCQSDNFCEATSPITGHRLRVNLSFNRVFVPADMPIDRARALGAQLPAYWKRKAATGNNWSSAPQMRAAYHAFADVETMHDFMSALDRMLNLVADAKSPRAHVFRILIWLTRLWAHGLIAVPPRWTTEYRVNCPISEFTVGPHLAWLEEIAAVAFVKSEREAQRAKGLALRIATTAVGIQDLGDITPATTAPTVRDAWARASRESPKPSRAHRKSVTALRPARRSHNGASKRTASNKVRCPLPLGDRRGPDAGAMAKVSRPMAARSTREKPGTQTRRVLPELSPRQSLGDP